MGWRRPSTRRTSARVHQRGRLLQQADHVEERRVGLLVGGRGGDDAVHVPAHEAVRQRRAAAGGAGVAQVLAGGDHPGAGVGLGHRRLDAGRGRAQVAATGPAPVVGQHPVEGLGGQGGRAHALAVDGVEGAHGVADGHERGRGPAQLLEVPPLVGGVPVADDRGQRLQLLDHVGQDRRPQPADEGGEPVLVGRRDVAVGAGDRQHPAVVLQREEHRHPGRAGRPGLEEDRLVARHGLVADPPVGAGGVAEVGVDRPSGPAGRSRRPPASRGSGTGARWRRSPGRRPGARRARPGRRRGGAGRRRRPGRPRPPGP